MLPLTPITPHVFINPTNSMMGRIPGDVRGGLLELFYGVYNRDADRCLEALITMGVLVSHAAVTVYWFLRPELSPVKRPKFACQMDCEVVNR